MSENQKIELDNLQNSASNEPPSQGVNSQDAQCKPDSNPLGDASIPQLSSKFKSVENLIKAYSELEKKHGLQSRELGELRKIAEQYNAYQENKRKSEQQLKEFQTFIQNIEARYQSDNYLKNKEFREILKAAYNAYGNNLDVDSMVTMLENYMNARASLASKISAIQDEANSATDMLAYSNSQSNYKNNKKRLSDMSPEELDKALDELM